MCYVAEENLDINYEPRIASCGLCGSWDQCDCLDDDDTELEAHLDHLETIEQEVWDDDEACGDLR
jgi:hypothetical protein